MPLLRLGPAAVAGVARELGQGQQLAQLVCGGCEASLPDRPSVCAAQGVLSPVCL